MVKLHMFKVLKDKFGFTATEILLVTTILSSIPATSFIGVKNKALQLQCANNLTQIGQAVTMFVASEGKYPDAKFFPKNPLKDPRSIVVILKPYGLRGKVFICPTAPPILKSKGLTYLWNDQLSGKYPSRVRNTSNTWMMTDITAVDNRISSHSGGYNILYADGHVSWSSKSPVIKK